MTTLRDLLLIVSLLLCSIPEGACASIPLGNLISFDSEDGLSSSTVYHAYQDRQGYIWFGTEYGVYRYDGYTFQHFSELQGLPDNAIIRIQEDRKGRIWFYPTNGKPSFYYRGQLFSEKNLEVLEFFTDRKHIWDITSDSHNEWWFAINNAPIAKVSPNGKLTKFPLEMEPLRMGNPLAFLEQKGGMWVFCNYGLFPLEQKDATPILFDPEDRITGRYCRRRKGGFLFVTNDNRIISYNRGDIQDFQTKPLPGEILYLMEDSQERLWVGTRKGLYMGKPGNFQRYLEEVAITSILEDREGNIWLTSLGEGVMMLPGFRIFSPTDERLKGKVQRIESDLNRVWVGFDNSRLVGLSSEGVRTYNFLPQNEGLPLLRDIQPLDSTSFLVGYDNQSYLVRGERVVPLPFAFGPKQWAKDGKGGIIAVFPYRLVHFDSQDIWDWEFGDLSKIRQDTALAQGYYVSRTIFEFRGSALYPLDSNQFLLAGVDGLNLLRDDSIVAIPKPLAPIQVRTTQFLPAEGGLWVATLGQGAFFFKEGKWFQLGAENGLLDPYCTSIFKDGRENIWIGTPRGLHFIPKGYRIPMRYFTIKNGLPSNEISGIGQVGDSLWIGTSKGLCWLDLQNLNAFLDPPQLSISGLLKNGISMNPRLKASFLEEDHIEVNIAAISFRNQGRALFRFQLQDEDGDEVVRGESYSGQLSFHGLEPGEYTLKVQASNGGRKWGEPVELLGFEVETALQISRWWLLVLVISVLIVLGFLLWLTERRRVKSGAPVEHWINLKVDGKVRRLKPAEISFVKASGDFVEVFLDDEKILYRSTMKNMESLVTKVPFMIRVHRSYLVNISKVRSYSGKELDLPGHMVPLSKSYRTKVIPLLEKRDHSS